MLRRHSRHVVKSSITKWRIQWWSEWNAFIPAALSARSLVCHALLDNAAVGTDPITRLSPFALAKLARPQDCITLPCRVIIIYSSCECNDQFFIQQFRSAWKAIRTLLASSSRLCMAGNRLSHMLHYVKLWLGWEANNSTTRLDFLWCFVHRLVQNDLQFHSLLTWFLLGCCQSFLQTKVLPKKIARASTSGKHFLPEQWWLLPACSHQIQPQLISVSRTAGWWVVLKNASWAQDMSMVLGAFARMRYRDRDMMLRIAESTPEILGHFAATDITLLAANADRSMCFYCVFLPIFFKTACIFIVFYSYLFIHISDCWSWPLCPRQSFHCLRHRWGTTWQHLLVWTWNIAWFLTWWPEKLPGQSLRCTATNGI